MRLIHLVFLLFVAASASATVESLAAAAGGVATGAVALGKTFLGLLPTGILFPLALVKGAVVLKTAGLLKLKVLKAPLIAKGVAAKVDFAGKVKAHLFKTANDVGQFVHHAPFRLLAAKAGAFHGAVAGAKVGLATAKIPSEPTIVQPEVIHASEILSQAQPAVEPQPESEVPSYGAKPAIHSAPAPAYLPPAPAYTPPALAEAAPIAEEPAAPVDVPAPEPQYRKRRQAEVDEALEKAIAEAFEFIKQEDDDQCIRRSMCAIAVQPDLAKNYGTRVVDSMNSLRDDASASWYPYKQAVAMGEKLKSHEACVQEYPTCQMDSKDLISRAIRQLG